MTSCAKLAIALGPLNALAVGQALAQYGGYRPPSLSTPAVSPYLNILRRGQDPALNFYNLYQPQVQYGGAIQQLQTQTTANRQAITGLETGGTAAFVTGHRSGFMNHYAYFLNNNTRGALAGTPGLTPGLAGTAAFRSNMAQGAQATAAQPPPRR